MFGIQTLYVPLSYISDNAGNRTAVLIPIGEWELLVRKQEDLKQLEQPNQEVTKRKPSDFAGTMPADVTIAFTKYVEEGREQWD